jgi:hypothetical protein
MGWTDDAVAAAGHPDQLACILRDAAEFRRSTGFRLDDAPAMETAAAEIERLARERDGLAEACQTFLGQLDYLRNLWGDEGVTRSVADKARAAIAILAP